MIEMVLLDAAKQTANKVRWDADIDGTRFSLYIPKWRVPVPWPELIRVTIEEGHAVPRRYPTAAAVSPETDLLASPVVAHVRAFHEHTQPI